MIRRIEMAQRRRRTRKTDATDKPVKKDPVVVQRAPEPEVVEAIKEIPETPPVAEPVEEPREIIEPTPGKFASLNLKHFTEEWIELHAASPVDLLDYYANLKKDYQAKRSTNLPGDDEAAAKILERLNELRRIVTHLGYPA
jgi:hypothetical protein